MTKRIPTFAALLSALLLLSLEPGCEQDNDILGIAQMGQRSARRAFPRIPRDRFGANNDAESLAIPELGPEGLALFDRSNPDSPLSFFVEEHDAEEGVGPVFNQSRCLGCHQNSQELPPEAGLGDLTTESTPASRAGRLQVTTYAPDGTRSGDTAAFTLFGDYHRQDGIFDGLQQFGGPVLHAEANGGCEADRLPPEAGDPNLSSPGWERAVGERAGPPYLGRGLMEAIYAEDLIELADPADLVNGFSESSRRPSAFGICGIGDCISGRVNTNAASRAIRGGDPKIRIARFGLRAAGTTLAQFMVGGSQGELGMTSPLSPEEPSNPLNLGRSCDIAPDPELSVSRILGLRALIRAIGIPDFDRVLLNEALVEPGPEDPMSHAGMVRRGAELFGLDPTAFRDRMIEREENETALLSASDEEEHGIAIDRGLGCVSCHTPIQATGISPAEIGGDLLSNRWAPLFSDLLIHDMGEVPDDLDPRPLGAFAKAYGFNRCQEHYLRGEDIRGELLPEDAPNPCNEEDEPRSISRNLADFALPGQGSADGREWRTPPMMGIGRIGPPFMHDARAFVALTSNQRLRIYHHYLGMDEPDREEDAPPSIDDNSRFLPVVTVNDAFRAAIELHDLPQPPDYSGDGVPDYELCPPPGDGPDVCSRNSPYRSEARLVMERWHNLTPADQDAVIAFLRTL